MAENNNDNNKSSNMDSKSDNRGWHGDSEGHARAGRQSGGKFEKGSTRAKEAGQKGGSR